MLLKCGVGEDAWESLELQGDPISQFWRKSVLNIHWKDWCWSWNSNTLATWCNVLTLWKGPWCWERLKAGEEGMTEAEMVRWHHWLDGHEFGQVLGVGDRQGSFACCSPWGLKELDITEPLDWTDESESVSRSVMSYSLWPHGLYSAWNSSGQSTGVGSHSLLQRIFSTQGSYPSLLHCRWIL